MQKDDQGVWTATTDALAPDYYAYSFVVDGTNVNDPVNRQLQTSFGSAQSMFVIPGSQPCSVNFDNGQVRSAQIDPIERDR